ncbi:MAG: aminotransferase class V-fold PLP-dependent enzyme [Sphingobium sp.]
MARRVYLDHAATTPMVAPARDAMMEAAGRWANPSSPHADGRAARAMLEDARGRIAGALGWQGTIIFTSGASEAIAIALSRAKAAPLLVSPVEHDAVLRCAGDAQRLVVDGDGVVVDQPIAQGALVVVQHVNNETGVIQPVADIAQAVHDAGGVLFVDCAQSAGKIDLPAQADMIAISAHKFGGPPGVGALLVRDLMLLHPSGGQEQGYRGGTENVPGVMAMAAALEASRAWLERASGLRRQLDAAIVAAGGEVVAAHVPRIATIASYQMPGVSARAQLIQFDMAGIAVSAGAACSSGTLKTSPVLRAMGWDAAQADEVIRISFGPDTDEAGVARLMDIWRGIAGVRAKGARR